MRESMLKDFIHWLQGPAHHRSGIRAFQFCIGVALLFRCATEGPFAAWLYGPDGLGRGSMETLLGSGAVLFDWIYGDVRSVYAVVVVEAIAALLLVTGRAERLGVVLALVSSTILEWRTVEINDGGDNITHLALVYMLLVTPSNRSAPAGSFAAYFHNLGVVLLIGQVLVLYMTAGMAKAMGEPWTNGTALYLISQADEFSLPSMRWMFESPFVTVAATYATVLWQVTFPVAVFSRFKLAYVAVGIAFHVGVAGFMGLVTFSLVMLGAELLLITDAEYMDLHALGQRARQRLGSMLASRRGLA